MLKKLLKGSSKSPKVDARFRKLAEAVNGIEEEIKALSDEELKAETAKFKA